MAHSSMSEIHSGLCPHQDLGLSSHPLEKPGRNSDCRGTNSREGWSVCPFQTRASCSPTWNNLFCGRGVCHRGMPDGANDLGNTSGMVVQKPTGCYCLSCNPSTGHTLGTSGSNGEECRVHTTHVHEVMGGVLCQDNLPSPPSPLTT